MDISSASVAQPAAPSSPRRARCATARSRAPPRSPPGKMAPPGRRAGEPHQARRLGRRAVRGHQLLLLADGAQEAERVRAEADQCERRERRQRERRAHQHGAALAPPPRGQHDERQHHPGGDLDAHPGHHRDRALAQAAAAGIGRRRLRAGGARPARGTGRRRDTRPRRRPCAGPPAPGRVPPAPAPAPAPPSRVCRCGPRRRRARAAPGSAPRTPPPTSTDPQRVRGVADEGDCGEAEERRDHLQRPQSAGQPSGASA